MLTLTIYVARRFHNTGQKKLVGFRPETPDEKLLVSVLESGDFFSWQGNRGVARRRTSVRRTSEAEERRRQGGKSPFLDGN